MVAVSVGVYTSIYLSPPIPPLSPSLSTNYEQSWNLNPSHSNLKAVKKNDYTYLN